MQADRRQFMQRVTAVAATATLPTFAAPALAKSARVRTYSGLAFGTQWRLILAADKSPDKALKPIKRILNQIDASISPYRTDSILSRFNRSKVDTITHVTPDLANLVDTSTTVARLSGGAFDPTAGPLVNQFGFGPITGSTLCNYRDVRCSQRKLIKQKVGLTLDLCGLGKGYAVDLISQNLKQLGFTQFLFDIGGEIIGVGNHPSGRAWRVGIEPDNTADAHQYIVELSNVCVATSGLQHNHFLFKEKQYGHLVDTSTNTVATPRCHSVSVMHSNATLADAYSTALFVAGPKKGLELARLHNLSAFFMASGTDQSESARTGSFLHQFRIN